MNSKEDNHRYTAINITPLETKTAYNNWAIRCKAHLQQHSPSLWDNTTKAPKDAEKAAAFLISVMSKNLLEHVSATAAGGDLKAPVIWKHFQDTFITSDLSSKSAVLNHSISFRYDSGSIINEKTALLNLRRELQAAFKNSTTITIDELITLFALVNLPVQYQTLWTTLEETSKSTAVSCDGRLFSSLLREEAYATSSAQRMGSPPVSPKTTPAKCQHNYPPKLCWVCHPNKKPQECSICKSNGFSKTRHPTGSDFCDYQQFRHKNDKSGSNLASGNELLFNVDSGSTDTLVSNEDGIDIYSSLHHPINTANGATRFATAIGKVGGEAIDLNQVLFVPSVKENLLSVSKLINQVLMYCFPHLVYL